MSFFGKINFNDLSETDRVIYHFMASNSDKIPYMRVRDIALESHTSAASVMRFVHKIGYESFTEFKAHFSSSSMQSTELLRGFQVLSKERFPSDIDTKLRIIAEKMQQCENIIFFGMGASGSICEYAARRFSTIGCNSFALIDPTYPILAKLKNTSENMLITLSVTGKTTEVVEVVNGFRNKNDCITVSITSDRSSTLAKMSDYVLDYRTEVRRVHKHEDLTSQIPCIFLIEALSEALIQLEQN